MYTAEGTLWPFTLTLPKSTWLRAKHKRKGAGATRYSDQLLHDQFGLVVSMHELSAFRGQHREPFSESWMHEMCLQFDEREEETEPRQTGLRRPGEKPDQSPPGDYRRCASSRLHSKRRQGIAGSDYYPTSAIFAWANLGGPMVG